MNFILKVTKQCNLRCTYCYETRCLDEQSHWSFDQIEIIFEKLKRYYESLKKVSNINFIWHGGEPTILGPKYYEIVSEIQEKIFNPKFIKIINSIQTNLTLWDDGFIPLFKKFFINRLGISLDVYGGNRKFKDGNYTEHIVLENIQKLIDNQIAFSAICVLTKQNRERIEDIYEFFNNNYIDFSILPVVRGDFQSNIKPTALTVKEFTDTMTKLYSLWINDSDCNIVIRNFQDFIGKLIWKDDARVACFFQNNCQEGNILINTDGYVYPCSDLYEKSYCYGNIFDENFVQILNSLNRKKLLNRFEYIKNECGDCKYLSLCAGGCMYESKIKNDLLKKTGRCFYYKSLFKIIEKDLVYRGILNQQGESLIKNLDTLRQKTKSNMV